MASRGFFLKAEFALKDIDRKVEAHKRERVRRMFEFLSYVGIESVNYAKDNGDYQDQTGNLRASVGYAVIVDGEVKRKRVIGKAEGKSWATSLFYSLADEYPSGMVLVVVAGMEYAAAVESKGYDVITGSSFEGEKLLSFMREKLGAIRS